MSSRFIPGNSTFTYRLSFVLVKVERWIQPLNRFRATGPFGQRRLEQPINVIPQVCQSSENLAKLIILVVAIL